MARALREEQLTPADELRQLLTDSEKLIGGSLDQPGHAVQLLENMDRIAELWPRLEQGGADLRPEAGRWESLQGMVHRQAARISRASCGLRAARRAKHLEERTGPDQPRWWWYLDQEVHRRQGRSLLRAGLTAAVIVAVLVAASLLIRMLFPVDPKVTAAAAAVLDGQAKIQNGNDLAGAIADFRRATTVAPSEPDGWVWLGGSLKKQGDAEGARQAFQHARALYGTDLDFYLARIPVYYALQMLPEAQADVDAALAIDPQNPQAYYYEATLLEAEGTDNQAVEALQKAGDCGAARGQAEITAMARLRLGVLLQQMQVGPYVSTSTPAP